MKKQATSLLGVGLIFSASALLPASADETTESVKKIMGAVNKGPKSLTGLLKTAFKADEPKWEGIQKDAKRIAELTDAMAKLKPKKGDGASWDKLAGAYAADAKELHEAADKKDKTAALAAFKKLETSCKSCHTAHK